MTGTGQAAPSEWRPDPARFLADLEAKPVALERLAHSTRLDLAIAAAPSAPRSVLFLGMGSSRYAAEVGALQMRARGIHAVAEYASARRLPPVEQGQLVVAISASGSSKETVAALDRYAGHARTMAITESLDSTIASMADIVLPLEAGSEDGGVACRSFQHSGLILARLTAAISGEAHDFAALCGRVAEGTLDLLDRRDVWLSETAAALDGVDGLHVLAPVERWSSAAQSALMLREGPRRVASASETGDWNHVDVYLTKTTDYRALLLSGSPYDEDAIDWMRRRGSTVVSVGAAARDVRHAITYRHCDEEAVALHTETLVAELLAAHWWAEGSER